MGGFHGYGRPPEFSGASAANYISVEIGSDAMGLAGALPLSTFNFLVL
jgi:hypothetical protein